MHNDFSGSSDLKERIEQALADTRAGGPGVVDFTRQYNNIITETLRAYVCAETGPGGNPVYVQVRYSDGSQGRPFPLQGLRRRKQQELNALQQTQPVRASLISMRHMGMDITVDITWLRNVDVSQRQTHTYAEIDEHCYQQTRQRLRDMLADGPFKLHLYETGFQPAIVGTLRAFTEELLRHTQGEPVLCMIPYYFVSPKKYYRPGKAWY